MIEDTAILAVKFILSIKAADFSQILVINSRLIDRLLR